MNELKDLNSDSFLEYINLCEVSYDILDSLIEKSYRDIGISLEEIKKLFLNVVSTSNTDEEILNKLNSWKKGFVFIKDNKLTSSDPKDNNFIRARTITKDSTYPKGTLVIFINEYIFENMLNKNQSIEYRIFGYKQVFELISHEIIHDQQIEKAAIDLAKVTKNRLNELYKYPVGPIRTAIYKEYFANKNEIDAYAKQCCEELINNGVKIDTAINLLKYTQTYNELKVNSIVFKNYFDMYFIEDKKTFHDFISSVVWFLGQRKEETNGTI